MSFNTGNYSSSKLMEEIKYLIKDEGLSQEEFAKELFMTRKSLNRLLNGQNEKPDFEQIILICKRLGIKTITID